MGITDLQESMAALQRAFAGCKADFEHSGAENQQTHARIP